MLSKLVWKKILFKVRWIICWHKHHKVKFEHSPNESGILSTVRLAFSFEEKSGSFCDPR